MALATFQTENSADLGRFKVCSPNCVPINSLEIDLDSTIESKFGFCFKTISSKAK